MTTNIEDRPEGHYWVKRGEDYLWEICYFLDSHLGWLVMGEDAALSEYTDSSFQQIGERILPPDNKIK